MEEYGSMGFAEKPKYTDGFGFRLFYAIIVGLNAAWAFPLMFVFGNMGNDATVETIMCLIAGLAAVLFSALGFMAAIKGRTCLWANTLSITIGIITCVVFFGVFAIIGGVKGKKAIRIREHEIVGLYNEKEVTRYSAHRYSVKLLQIVAVSYFVMPVLFVLAPLLALGLGKCRKRFIVFAVFFSVGLVLFGVFFGLFLTTLGNMKETFHGINISFLYCIFWSVGAALLGIFWLCSFIGLCTYVHNHQYIASVEQDTKKLKGKIGLAEFRKALVEKSKARDVDGFIGVLAAASEEYEARKHLIVPNKQLKEKINKTVIDCAVAESKRQAKALRKSMKGLYKRRKYEEINALSDSYAVRCAAKRDELLKNNKGAPIALEYDGKSTFDGNILQRIGWNILCRIIMTLTLGIMYPTVLCIKMNWQVKHTVYNGKRLSFDGKGLQLFGKWICWWLLCVITLGIYTIFVAKKLEQWKAKHTHIAGEPAVLGGTFDGGIIVSWLYGVLCGLLNLITLGIAKPFSTCIKLTWKYKHTVYDGRRLSFNGNGLQLFGNYIKWWLLTVITLGIYSYFVTNRMLKWQAVHTSLSEQSELVM